ncbi:MAG: S8 family serine peptidase [Cyanobacteria bacterium P01_F01_bin.143]
MTLNSLSLQDNNSSAVSNVLLQLAENTDNNFDNSDNISNDSLAFSTNLLLVDETINRIAVRITAEDIDILSPFLDNLKFETIGSAPEYHFIEGTIPLNALSNLEVLAEEGLIMGVLPVYKPILYVGDTDSQADFVLEADRVRKALPISYDGTGQTIAVFSDSYDISGNGSAATDIASGDLPTGVTILQEYTGTGIDEGRAMLQLIHDLAPGADLVFSSFFFGETNAAQQIRDAAIGDADVLVDDIGFLVSPFFQDGIVAQAIDEVVTNYGVTYFSSAGNSADHSYESTDINFTDDSAGAFSDIFYDFDLTAGIDSRQEIVLEANQSILATLQWDDPFYTADGVDTDLLFGLIDSSNNVYAIADENNIANQTPYEFLVYTNNTGASQTLEIIITKVAGPDPTHLKYINFRHHNPTEYDTKSSTIFGHAAATNAQSVAAIPFFDQDNPESFTSQGPTTILFEPDGTPLAVPEIRQTPDIAAIDGTNTTFFGSDLSTDLDTFPNFFGTSAAAPHAAAVAALIQQANPSLTPQQVYGLLQSTTEDATPSVFDNVTGFGLINAYDAIFGAVVPASLPFVANFDDGDLPLAFETNTNGAGRIAVTNDFSPLGAQQLTFDSSAEGVDSLNEAILYLDTTGFTDIILSFEQKDFGDEEHPMSASFVGSENSDGVALSVDGTNWYRLVDLTGVNSISSFQPYSLDLTAIAASHSLTLGADVQIKFQQFDNFSIANDGFAFDNISVTGTLLCNPTSGNDDLTSCATSGDDNINGLGGDDSLAGGNGNDTLIGANGNDLLNGQNNDDSLTGGNGNDTVNGGNGVDVIWGQNDDDSLTGGNGNDTLSGGNGVDVILGNNDDDRLIGGDGNDTLNGGNGSDVIFGSNDDDRLTGGNGNDTLNGGNGIDVIWGQDDDDRLIGGDGNDTLGGGIGADILLGNNDDDKLIGGDGDDTLVGGLGLDTLSGGTGSDRFRLESTTTDNRDIIKDFADGTDFLDLTGGLGFGDLTITQDGTKTNIIETATNQILAVLNGIDAVDITLDDFV